MKVQHLNKPGEIYNVKLTDLSILMFATAIALKRNWYNIRFQYCMVSNSVPLRKYNCYLEWIWGNLREFVFSDLIS